MSCNTGTNPAKSLNLSCKMNHSGWQLCSAYEESFRNNIIKESCIEMPLYGLAYIILYTRKLTVMPCELHSSS